MFPRHSFASIKSWRARPLLYFLRLPERRLQHGGRLCDAEHSVRRQWYIAMHTGLLGRSAMPKWSLHHHRPRNVRLPGGGVHRRGGAQGILPPPPGRNKMMLSDRAASSGILLTRLQRSVRDTRSRPTRDHISSCVCKVYNSPAKCRACRGRPKALVKSRLKCHSNGRQPYQGGTGQRPLLRVRRASWRIR